MNNYYNTYGIYCPSRSTGWLTDARKKEFGSFALSVTDLTDEYIIAKNIRKPTGTALVIDTIMSTGIEASHMCMQMRGVEKQNSVTTTSDFTGAFNRAKTREEFMNLIAPRK